MTSTAERTTNIQHVKGKNDVVAHFLSRIDDPEVASLKAYLELKALVELQKDDEDICSLLENQRKDSKYKLKEINLPLSLSGKVVVRR